MKRRTSVIVQPKKPALYKLDDIVRVKWNEELRTGFSTSKARNNITGLICKISKIEIKSAKWFYTLDIIHGCYKSYSSNYRATNDSYNSFYIYGFEKQIERFDYESFSKILEKSKFKKGDAVTVKAGTIIDFRDDDKGKKYRELDKSYTLSIFAIAVEKTIELQTTYYAFKEFNGFVRENYLNTKNILDAIENSYLINEIKKNLDVNVAQGINDKEAVFELESIDANFLKRNKKVYFKTLDDKIKCVNELYEVINKYVYTKAQKEFDVDVILSKIDSMLDATTSWSYPKINIDKLPDFARNIGIDVDKFLEENKNAITSSKMGI